jgi:hypothetical protein
MINELTLSNFRGFGSLELRNLKRVNLVVGHNNTGKTSLLEGVLLLSDPERINELPALFRPPQGHPRLRCFPWLIKDGAQPEDVVLTCKNETDKNDVEAESGEFSTMAPRIHLRCG